jgi:hypothetical protein
MPLSADTSPFIKYPLPEINPAFSVENIFDENIFNEIKNRIDLISWGPGSEAFYHTSMGRWETPLDHSTKYVDNSSISIDEKFRDLFSELGNKYFKRDDLVFNFSFAVRYQKQNGNIPLLHKHMDQGYTPFTIDICIDKHNVDWGIEVDGEVFKEKENGAVCFGGNQQVHSRPAYPENTTEEDYLVVMFLHYTTKDHWLVQAKENDEEWDTIFKKIMYYTSDADVRYYLTTGAISFPQLPEGQKMCPCHNYTSSEPSVMNILKNGFPTLEEFMATYKNK